MDEVLLKEFGASLSGIEVILQFHRSLLVDLEKAVESWTTATKLGELFERVVRFVLFCFFSVVYLGCCSLRVGVILEILFSICYALSNCRATASKEKDGQKSSKFVRKS